MLIWLLSPAVGLLALLLLERLERRLVAPVTRDRQSSRAAGSGASFPSTTHTALRGVARRRRGEAVAASASPATD